MREHEPGVPGAREPVRERGAGRGSEGQQEGPGDVVVHRAAEAGGERAVQPPGEGHAVGGHRAGHEHRADQRDRPGRGHHADDDGGDARVEQHQPPYLPPARRVLVTQQGLGEVRAPHQDRVGHRAQQHEVHEQPAGGRNPPVGDGDDHEGHEPEDDTGAGTDVPAAPVADGVRPAALLRGRRGRDHRSDPTDAADDRRRRARGREARRAAPTETTTKASRARTFRVPPT